MGKRTELDRLWKWTKMYMRNKAGDHKGRPSSSMSLENVVSRAVWTDRNDVRSERTSRHTQTKQFASILTVTI